MEPAIVTDMVDALKRDSFGDREARRIAWMLHRAIQRGEEERTRHHERVVLGRSPTHTDKGTG